MITEVLKCWTSCVGFIFKHCLDLVISYFSIILFIFNGLYWCICDNYYCIQIISYVTKNTSFRQSSIQNNLNMNKKDRERRFSCLARAYRIASMHIAQTALHLKLDKSSFIGDYIEFQICNLNLELFKRYTRLMIFCKDLCIGFFLKFLALYL